MDMTVLPLFITHLNTFVRKYVAGDTHYLMTLDGHSSRKGFEWVELCMKNKLEAVVAPANTSHFLQPCDQDVNKTFQGRVRLVRDELTKYVITDTKSIGVKLMCGVCAFKEISAADCAMAFRFAKREYIPSRGTSQVDFVLL